MGEHTLIAREKFFTYLQKLEIAYSPKLKFNQNLVDLWYESFADCDERDFNQAVNQCIRENEFPPTIATLMKFYKEIKEEINEKLDYIIIDEFASEKNYYNYLSDTNNPLKGITFITKAEDKNLAVACASLISR